MGIEAIIMLAILAAAIGGAIYIYRAGRRSENAEQRERDAAAVRKANNVEQAVDARSPEENRERLGRWSR